jgi:hypothetical protein
MTQSHSDYIFGLHPARHVLTEDIDRVLEIWIQQGQHRSTHRIFTGISQTTTIGGANCAA